jgi:hypothetical protein
VEGLDVVDGDWVAARRGCHRSTSWVVDVEGGWRRSCAAGLRAMRLLLLVDGYGDCVGGIVLVRQVAVGSCRCCYFEGAGLVTVGCCDGV